MRKGLVVGALVPYCVHPTETLASVLPGNTPATGTLAFRGLSASRKTYWIKVPNQSQGPRVLATEQIVSAIGRLIGAPVRDTALIEVTSDWEGWVIAPGLTLEPCIAHASLELPHATESDSQEYMRDDDNSRRWARWVALWDWCMGADGQWLYEHDADRSMWSFDHNLWIHDQREWGRDTCNGGTLVDWRWRGDWSGIDASELMVVADLLDEVKQEDICSACYAVPAEWNVPVDDLDALVEMLFKRRAGVAARLRANSSVGLGG